MAFKQQGFNPGEGTGMGSAFTKKVSPLTSPADKYDPMGENQPKFRDVVKTTDKPSKPTRKLKSKLTVVDKKTETTPKTDIDAVTVTAKKGKGSKKKKDDKTISKAEYKIAKVQHSQGKISDEELAASKEKKKKSQTGREKIRMKTKKIKSDVTKKIKDTKKKFTKSDEEKELKQKQKLAKLKRKNPKKYAKLEQASKTISGI